MSDEVREALEIVSVRILEEAAFLFADAMPPASAPTGNWGAVGAEIRWSGPSSGAMRVWSTQALLRLLAANMLGVEESDPAVNASGFDALREILNMVTGNCLTEAWGPGPVFHLEIPRAADQSLLAADAEAGFWISADDHPVLFWNGIA